MKYSTAKKFAVPLNRQEVSQSWNQRGYSCDVFIDPPGREWNDFVHSTNELVTVVEGKLRMIIVGGKRLSRNPEMRYSFRKRPVIR